MIIDISEDQVNSFAGNILEVRSITGDPFVVMSTQAYRCFTTEQLNLLRSWAQIIHSPLDTIERGGGGSARCMLAEVFY